MVEEPPATLNKHFALQSAQCGVDAGMRLVLAPASALASKTLYMALALWTVRPTLNPLSPGTRC